jgi:hypothetical protein
MMMRKLTELLVKKPMADFPSFLSVRLMASLSMRYRMLSP